MDQHDIEAKNDEPMIHLGHLTCIHGVFGWWCEKISWLRQRSQVPDFRRVGLGRSV